MQGRKLTDNVSARFDAVAISPDSTGSGKTGLKTDYRINWIKNILQ
jgi:hypothetical protein